MELISLVLGAFTAMLATALGAAGVFFFKCLNKRNVSILLSFSAGVMLFSSIEMLLQARNSSDLTAIMGFLAGVIVLLVFECLIPHVHMLLKKENISSAKKKAVLLVGSISLHNIPEGFAIASAFIYSTPLGWLVAASIALQDIPEGFLVSGPLACYGVKSKRSFIFGVLSGVIEFASAIVGFLFLSFVVTVVPFALAFSAGAMAFVVFVELLPDAMAGEFKKIALFSLVFGLITAFSLASLFGF
ncbi:MAG: ZIP family metal transporter [Candidatus Micrarchaeota archaeon]